MSPSRRVRHARRLTTQLVTELSKNIAIGPFAEFHFLRLVGDEANLLAVNLYDKPAGGGSSIELTSDHVDLKGRGWDDKARSIRIDVLK